MIDECAIVIDDCTIAITYIANLYLRSLNRIHHLKNCLDPTDITSFCLVLTDIASSQLLNMHINSIHMSCSYFMVSFLTLKIKKFIKVSLGVP